MEGGGHATLLIAVSHSGAEEKDSLGSVQQKRVQEGQALNQLRLLGPLTFSLLLLLNEELDQGGQLRSSPGGSRSKRVLLQRFGVPVISLRLPLNLAYGKALWACFGFSSV